MKKSEVISGAAGHRVSWNPQERVAGSKRPQKPSGSAEPGSRVRKGQGQDEALKNSGFMSISENTVDAMATHLDARIRRLGQVTDQLRTELEALARSSERKS